MLTPASHRNMNCKKINEMLEKHKNQFPGIQIV